MISSLRFIPRGFKRSVALAASAWAGAVGPLAGAEASATPAAPVVELEKMVVTDTRELPPAEAWRYAEIAGFEILSNASDKATQRLIREFQMFRQALGFIYPMPNRPGQPTALILSGKGGKFDAFMPVAADGANQVRASLFFGNREQSAIIVDLEASVLNVQPGDTTDDAATGTNSFELEIDHNKQLYREYVHFLMSKSDPRPPAWFEEGMAQIIMGMKFENAVYGKTIW